MIVTCREITYTLGLLRQFMHAPQEIHLQAAICVLANLKYALGRGLLYLLYDHLCVEADKKHKK